MSYTRESQSRGGHASTAARRARTKERDELIVELWHKGWKQYKIADRFDLVPSTVSYILKRMPQRKPSDNE